MNNETAQTWPHSSVFQDDMAQENMVFNPNPDHAFNRCFAASYC
jgi:hypothetical protein